MNRSPPTERSPRIIFVATDLSTGGGVNKVIRDLAVLLKRRLKAAVRVLNARSDRPSAYEFPDDLPVEMHRRRRLASYFALLIGLRRSRPDVVISSWTQDNILTALAFAFSRSKVILIEHTSWNHHAGIVRFLRRLAYPLAGAIVVLNPTELEYYSRFLDNVRLIPNPIASPDPLKENAREKMILAVGHLEPRKNFADAIRAMAMSGLEEEGWSLEIVGSGEQAQNLQALIAELGLKRTSIHAPVPDLSGWYSRASLTVVTARLEVFSLVLAEAMLNGVVPVAYATDGPAFLLKGFPDHLAPTGDVQQLANLLARFASLPDLNTLRQRLSTSIEQRFGEGIVAASWKDLLSQPAPAERQA